MGMGRFNRNECKEIVREQVFGILLSLFLFACSFVMVFGTMYLTIDMDSNFIESDCYDADAYSFQRTFLTFGTLIGGIVMFVAGVFRMGETLINREDD